MSAEKSTYGQAPSIDQVVKSFKDRDDSFFTTSHSVRLEFGRVESTDPIPSRFSGKYALTEWICIRNRENQWYFQQTILNSPFRAGEKTPPKPRVHIRKNNLSLAWYQANSRCVIRPDRKPTNVAYGWGYYASMSG